jgi:molybdopterin molybdotransferase
MNKPVVDECVTPGLKPVDQTIDDLLASVQTVCTKESIPTETALNRILASDVRCPFDFPPWPASAMDGYAFRLEAGIEQQSLRLVGSALAGHPFSARVSPGECVRITTGAPLPDGTDTVEMQENCTVSEDRVTLLQIPVAGQHVRQVGSSIPAGKVILKAGCVLGPKELAMIASSGQAQVEVYSTLKIAIFTTGDELVCPGVELAPGQIYDSNRLTMRTMCERMGFHVKDYGLVPDEPEAIRKVMLEAAASANVLMTSGGVSVGDADYIKPVLEEIGTLSVWKVAIKPGKPLAIGNIDQCQFFGLPGNPVSTIITLNKIVKPALQKLSGQADSVTPVFKATCLDNLRKAAGRRDYQRGIATVDASGQWQVRSTGPQGSGRLISVAEGNCYIVLEADNDGVEAGDVVNIELFDRSLE